MAGLDRRLILLAALAAATPASAASPEGVWRTPSRGGVVELSACGQALCGRLLSTNGIRDNPALPDGKNRDRALRTRPLKNLEIVQGFTGGPTEWTGGTVYNPEDGGTYRGRIVLVDDDRLKLTGCTVFPLCKTQVWTRAVP
jgi:uncharacterized protein (DUF2147 family)